MRRYGYGYGESRSDHRESTMDEHVASIRNVLEQIDPETGYIED